MAAFATLLGSSAALTALAVYQWLELIELRAGRPVACAVNATFNCAKVWDTPLSHRVHDWVGVPVAGLGVLWGVVAFGLAALALQRVRSGGDVATFSGAVKTCAWAGLLATVMFISASVQAKALCITCLTTYALTAAYAFGALKLLGGAAIPDGRELMSGAGWGLVLTVPIYLALLIPGSRTPKQTAAVVPALDKQDPNDFEKIVDGLPERERLAAAWARAEWKKAPKPDVSAFPTRLVKGPAGAPVKMVEWSDILCGHCAQFEEVFHEVERMAPANGLAFEPRQYPLDGECNPEIKGSRQDGVRCYGAKLQICTEKSPKFWDIRKEIFQNQERLDQGLMLAIATRHGVSSSELDACIRAPETQARLIEDIEYAKRFGIEGTPMVVLNGKVAPPSPVFLIAMTMSGGNPDSPVLLRLPPPPVD
jgi:serine/threonine-protein kinase